MENKIFDEERALYGLKNETVSGCVFSGPADGESALKQCSGITVKSCRFDLRYPLWHVNGFNLSDSVMSDTARAPLWYCQSGIIDNCRINSVKAVRECVDITVKGSAISSPEFGWKCRNLKIEDSEISGEYLLLDTDRAETERLELKGKYSFQYTKDVTVTASRLDTKDAFWHSENVTVKDSVIKGEYLGWYSKNLTLINCKIEGTQPLCYCENLTLVNCDMTGADLAFEHSSVNADIYGELISIKNPLSGKITADKVNEIIMSDPVFNPGCEIIIR